MSAEAIAECRGAGVVHGTGERRVVALHPTSCTIFARQQLALVGPSGSGKSTLIHLLSGLQAPTSGTVAWPALAGRPLRPGPIGVVFQGPSLLPPLTVLENVALPLHLMGGTRRGAAATALELLALVGVEELAERIPDELSGGQAQRVAIARALVTTPSLILADEPTSQLDSANAELVTDALLDSADATGAALVVTTHDPTIADRFDLRWTVADGLLAVSAGVPAP
jgi:ABC-type lipoprotein export system ATPase subunit